MTFRGQKKPPQAKLSKGVSDSVLIIIAKHVLYRLVIKGSWVWSETLIIEDIREDHRNSNAMQKITMLSTWKRMHGDWAILRNGRLRASRGSHR